MNTNAQSTPRTPPSEERICFLFRHFDRAGLDAIMTLSNRGALWVRRRPWSPKTAGTERGFVTSRAPLEDILEVRAYRHRPLQRWATVACAVAFAAAALGSTATPAIAVAYAGLALIASGIAKYWPPVLTIVARAGRFAYRGPWSMRRRTIVDVERALREVAAWTHEHGIPLVGGPKSNEELVPLGKSNPICIEITSFNPSASVPG